MAQAKVNIELAGLGADISSTDVSQDSITCSKSKINSAIQGMEGNM